VSTDDDNRPTQDELVLAFRAYCDAGNCRGRDGASPTPDDIASAFVQFCADGRCTGPEGKPGADAEPLAPEFEMVLAAVTQVCATGACTGPAGTNGVDGANATQEMVLAAVMQVCANDACRGPVGAQGVQGRGFADTYCQDNGLWRITYSDGTVDEDAGKCRDLPFGQDPTPKPTVPPIEPSTGSTP
jgi:hypothetical protein